MYPLISALSTYNPLQILVCIGVNNLVDHDHKIEDIKRDFDSLAEELGKGDQICVNFMELPYIPKVSRFVKDRHPVPDKRNRTVDIADLNRHLRSFQTTCPHKHNFYPSLAREGISKDPFEHVPINNRHEPDDWVERPLEKGIHLTNQIKTIIWGTVLSFFENKCTWPAE